MPRPVTSSAVSAELSIVPALMLAWALFKIKKYITPKIERKARERLCEWFGPEEGEEMDLTIPNFDSTDPRIIDVEAEEY